jgi:hypothetical protein
MQQVNRMVVQVLPAVCCQCGIAKQLKMRLQGQSEKALDFKPLISSHMPETTCVHTQQSFILCLR